MAIKRRKSKHKKRIRASIRNTMFIVFGFLIVLSVYNIFANLFLNTTEEQEEKVSISKETFKQTNTVNIKKNKYVEPEDLKENQPYVTEFLQNINTSYLYKYEGENVDKINAIYKVRGILKSSYLDEGKVEEFWNKEYLLLNEKEQTTQNNNLEIHEDIEIDISKYNKLVKDFVEEIQISISSKLCVIFEVDITAYVNGEMIVDNYKNEMQISLGDKITKITGNFDDDKEKTKIQKMKVSKETGVETVIGWGILAIACLFGFVKMKKDTKTKNRITNTFKIELNQILSACGDRIIKIESNNSIYGDSIIEVSDINELLKLSEETFKPILYYQVPNSNVAWFYIVLEKEIYRFILK